MDHPSIDNLYYIDEDKEIFFHADPESFVSSLHVLSTCVECLAYSYDNSDKNIFTRLYHVSSLLDDICKDAREELSQ